MLRRSLLEVLSEVPDPRQAQGRRDPLGAILALSCAAMLCNYRSYGANPTQAVRLLTVQREN
jgi:hypothetical protein